MPEIHKMLVLSTAHLPEEIMQNIEEYAIAYPNEYGAFVWVPDPHVVVEPVPPELWHVINYARKHDCVWIKFDNAGDTIPELQKWEW
jgi:hypothetical protein